LRLKCIKFDFCWSSATDPAGELTGLPQIPIAVFKGHTSKEREGKGNGRERTEKGGKGRKGGENDLTHPLSQIPGYATDRIYCLIALNGEELTTRLSTGESP